MIKLEHLQQSDWLVTELLSLGSVVVRILDSYKIEKFLDGYWIAAEIVALNSPNLPYFVDQKIIFFSNEKVDTTVVKVDVSKIHPVKNLDHFPDKIYHVLAQLVLLTSQQKFGSFCKIIGNNFFSKILVNQARVMGFNQSSRKCLYDFIVIAENIERYHTELLVNSSQVEAKWIILNTVEISGLDLIKFKKINLIFVALEELLSKNYWQFEASNYMRVNFSHLLSTESESVNVHRAMIDKHSTQDKQKMNFLMVNIDNESTKPWLTIQSENENLNIQVVNNFVSVTDELEKIDLIVVNHIDDVKKLSKTDLNKLYLAYNFDRNTILSIENFVAQGKYLLPFVPIVDSYFIEMINAKISSRLEPVSINVCINSDQDESLAWLMVSNYLINQKLSSVNISEDLQHLFLQASYLDHSNLVLTLNKSTKSNKRLFFELSCQQQTWQINDWRKLKHYTKTNCYVKKVANYQTGEIQFIKNLLMNIKNPTQIAFYSAWIDILQHVRELTVDV